MLILMNINGCLVHRTAEKVTLSNNKEMNEHKFTRFVEYLKVKKNFHYYRESGLIFLDQIMSHPRVKFAFNSSIMRKNIMPIIMKMFDKNISLFQRKMCALFDQEFQNKGSFEHNQEPISITGDRNGIIRDLNKVWNSKSCSDLSKHDIFGPENTIMLESDEVSVYNFHENSLIVDRYEREDVWPTEVGQIRDQFEILRKIKEDLFEILDKCEGDI